MRRTLCGEKNSEHSLVNKSLKNRATCLTINSFGCCASSVLSCALTNSLGSCPSALLSFSLFACFSEIKKQGINITAYKTEMGKKCMLQLMQVPFFLLVAFFFPFLFSSTFFALLFFGPVSTSGALIDILPFNMSPAYSKQLLETPEGWVGLWLNELSASRSSLSIALSKSLRRSFETEHFNAMDVAFRQICAARVLKFHYHLFISSRNEILFLHISSIYSVCIG